MVLNSLKFCLSGKLLISLWTLNSSFAGKVFLVVGSSLLSLQIYYAIRFWLVEFLLRNQLIAWWEFPCMLFIVFPLSLLIFYLSLIFVSLIYCVSWVVFPWVSFAWDSLCFLDLLDYFLSHIREFFNYYLFKYFLRSFLSLLLLGHL